MVVCVFFFFLPNPLSEYLLPEPSLVSPAALRLSSHFSWLPRMPVPAPPGSSLSAPDSSHPLPVHVPPKTRLFPGPDSETLLQGQPARLCDAARNPAQKSRQEGTVQGCAGLAACEIYIHKRYIPFGLVQLRLRCQHSPFRGNNSTKSSQKSH